MCIDSALNFFIITFLIIIGSMTTGYFLTLGIIKLIAFLKGIRIKIWRK